MITIHLVHCTCVCKNKEQMNSFSLHSFNHKMVQSFPSKFSTTSPNNRGLCRIQLARNKKSTYHFTSRTNFYQPWASGQKPKASTELGTLKIFISIFPASFIEIISKQGNRNKQLQPNLVKSKSMGPCKNVLSYPRFE